MEPQITVGLLTDATVFPLMIEAFESNKAETLTMNVRSAFSIVAMLAADTPPTRPRTS